MEYFFQENACDAGNRQTIHPLQATVGEHMLSLKLHALMIWLHSMGAWVPLGLAFLGIALFACCAFGCGGAPCKEKDQIFGRNVY
jgi:hypothetical protein